HSMVRALFASAPRPDRLRAPHECGEETAALGPCAQLPAGSGREAAAVRTDAVHSRPPVRKVVRLGEETPDLLPRGQQLAACDDAWHVGSVAKRAAQPSP